MSLGYVFERKLRLPQKKQVYSLGRDGKCILRNGQSTTTPNRSYNMYFTCVPSESSVVDSSRTTSGCSCRMCWLWQVHWEIMDMVEKILYNTGDKGRQWLAAIRWFVFTIWCWGIKSLDTPTLNKKKMVKTYNCT